MYGGGHKVSDTSCFIAGLNNVGASAHSTAVGNNFLDHAGHFTITYFSFTTVNSKIWNYEPLLLKCQAYLA